MSPFKKLLNSSDTCEKVNKLIYNNLANNTRDDDGNIFFFSIQSFYEIFNRNDYFL